MAKQLDSRTPRVQLRRGVKALITSADRVLLVKEKHADGSSFWTLPGGGVRRDESPTRALQRELVEELLSRVTVSDEITDVWYAHLSYQNRLSVYTVFECDLLSAGIPNLAEGIFDTQWARPDEIPPETLLQVRYVLAQYLRHKRESEARA
jgi:8-oxo-dGTP pyrophosphatase MutT (NUDIX family)